MAPWTDQGGGGLPPHHQRHHRGEDLPAPDIQAAAVQQNPGEFQAEGHLLTVPHEGSVRAE